MALQNQFPLLNCARFSGDSESYPNVFHRVVEARRINYETHLATKKTPPRP